VPLNQDKEMNGKELMDFYEVGNSPVYPRIASLTSSRKTSTSGATYTSSAIHLYTP
jgi:hypothetical protein